MHKKGVLLINLGTPNNADPLSVYRYLKEFLNDPRVIDLPGLIRWVLINLIIIPFRYKKSAEAYKTIWTPAGSPLLINSVRLKEALSAELGNSYQVELGMRYGNPTIQSALHNMQHCDQIIVLPLFPQYSSAATGSTLEKVMGMVAKQWNIPELYIKKDFYDHPGFISSYAELIKEKTNKQNIEVMIFSYHGLPERHIHKSQCKAACTQTEVCPDLQIDNAYCYRAQCFKTSELLAHSLNINPEQYIVAFQSRLGKTPWIKPYIDLELPELRKKGIKNIAVACPSFVADCLETLEEINIRLRAQWLELGGNTFVFIPCINDRPSWVKALCTMVTKDFIE